MNRISTAKNELIVPGDFAKQASDPVGKVAARVYERLQQRLKAANAFDFDDLLLYAYLLLKHHEDVLAAYQDRFRYIMVDEYQDTNHAQYAICGLLAAKHHNIMVVGDDDQSIYQLARRRHPQHPGVRAGLPRRQHRQAGAELPQRGQRAGRPPTPSSPTTSTARPKSCSPTPRTATRSRSTWPPTSATRAAGSPARSRSATARGCPTTRSRSSTAPTRKAACLKTCFCAPAFRTALSAARASSTAPRSAT